MYIAAGDIKERSLSLVSQCGYSHEPSLTSANNQCHTDLSIFQVPRTVLWWDRIICTNIEGVGRGRGFYGTKDL